MKPAKRDLLRTMLRATCGAVAVEFALITSFIVPVMLFGIVETVQILRANMIFEETASAFAQVVSVQTNGVTGASLRDYCTGVRKMMYPLSSAGLAVAVASVSRPANGGGMAMDWEVDYSCLQASGLNVSGIAPTMGSSRALTEANGLVSAPGDSALVVISYFPFQTTLSKLVPGVTNLTKTIVVSPRSGTTITCTAC